MTFIESILQMFSKAMGISFDFLTKDLAEFAPHVATVMETLNNSLQAFSYALLIILTLWNMVKTATSISELKRPELLLKFFLRFVLTKYAIGMAWKLVSGIVSITGSLTAAVFQYSGMANGNVWEGITTPTFENGGILGFLSSAAGTALSFLTNPLAKVPEMLLVLVGFIVALVLSVMLILTVIGRFFKIYLFAALSPIPLATFGAEDTKQIGKQFLQSFAAISLEGLVIALAMIVFSAYAQSPIIELGNWGIFDWLGSAADEVSYMFTMIFNMLLLMGLIKGADQVVHQIFSR